MKRIIFVVGTAIGVLALAVLLPRGAVVTSHSQAQATHIKALETRLAALEASIGALPPVAYQGYLVDGGEPINGQRALYFHIYNQETGGQKVWEETHLGVSISDGYFSVMLGEGNPANPLSIDDFSETERWIEVRVGTNDPMPRQRIGAVPYAFQAASVPALACRVIATNTQVIPYRVVTALNFDTEIHNVGNCWSSDNPTRLIAQSSGYYMAGGAVTYPVITDPEDGVRRFTVAIRRWYGPSPSDYVELQYNEARRYSDDNIGIGASVTTGAFYMNAQDYIEIWTYHTTEDATGEAKETLGYPAWCDPALCEHLTNGWLVKVGD